MIGAGIAAIALGGAGVGIGHIFGNYLAGALRNPAAAAASVVHCSSASPSPKRRASSASPSPCSFSSAERTLLPAGFWPTGR